MTCPLDEDRFGARSELRRPVPGQQELELELDAWNAPLTYARVSAMIKRFLMYGLSEPYRACRLSGMRTTLSAIAILNAKPWRYVRRWIFGFANAV